MTGSGNSYRNSCLCFFDNLSWRPGGRSALRPRERLPSRAAGVCPGWVYQNQEDHLAEAQYQQDGHREQRAVEREWQQAFGFQEIQEPTDDEITN